MMSDGGRAGRGDAAMHPSSGHGVRSFLAASSSSAQGHHHHQQGSGERYSAVAGAYPWPLPPQQQEAQPASFVPHDLGIPKQHPTPQQQHHAMHLSAATATSSSATAGVKSNHPPPPLEQPQGAPPLLGLPPESSRPSRKRPAAHQDPGHGLSPSPPPPPLLHMYQPPPPGQILAQNYIPLLTGVRQGELQEGVGLLPSMYADFMKGYEKPPKGRRAPREDLTTFTAEEKVERRKARARIYSDIARKRQEAINDRLKRDVVYMRCFRDLVEQAPCLMAVLAPDLEARVLFANAAFDRLLRLPATSVLGSSLWEWIHGDDDRARLQAVFTTVILTKTARVPVVRYRMRRDRRVVGEEADAVAVWVEVAFRRGTQGIICTLWVD